MVTKIEFLKDFITSKIDHVDKVMVPSRHYKSIKTYFPNIDIEETMANKVSVMFKNGIICRQDWNELDGND